MSSGITNSFEYKINKASIRDIEMHLNKCTRIFSPPLDTYVDIHKYAKKIRLNSVTVEAWLENEVIGLIGCYLNNKEILSGYITNLSVRQDYQNNGIALKLVELTIKEALKLEFKTITLEVDVENSKAIEIYKRSGFVLSSRVGSKYIMINRLLEDKDILVSICCLAYNHEPYIRECLEGFMMQKTTFPFEVLIHDDASTDNTATIIREYEAQYPDIIKPIYQSENQYSKGVGVTRVYQFSRAKGKYIAMCEGDDYWTDPYKLQKQVDFLEANPDYSSCWCRFKTLSQENGFYKIDLNEELFKNEKDKVEFDFERFYKSWHIGMQALVFRKDMLDSSFALHYKYTKDIHLITHLLIGGKSVCLNFFGAIYRKHKNGVYTGASDLQNAKIGYLSYKEIYTNNKQINYLELKFFYASAYYIKVLLKNRLYYESLLVFLKTSRYIIFSNFLLKRMRFYLPSKIFDMNVKRKTFMR